MRQLNGYLRVGEATQGIPITSKSQIVAMAKRIRARMQTQAPGKKG